MGVLFFITLRYTTDWEKYARDIRMKMLDKNCDDEKESV